MPPANICWQPFCPHILSHRPWSSWNQSSLGFPQAALYLSGVPRTLGASWGARSYSLSHPQPPSCLPFQTNSARAGHLLNWGRPGQWFTGALSLPSILSPWSSQGICHKKICEEAEVSALWHSLPKSCLGQVPPLLYFITACVVSFMFDFVSLSPTRLWVQEGSLLISR